MKSGPVRFVLTIVFVVAAGVAGYLAAWITQWKPWEETCAAATWFHDKHYDDAVFAERYERDFKIVLSHCPP
jgi:hypothetical protein